MLLSVLLWAGFFAIPFGLILLIPRRTRRVAVVAVVLACAAITIAFVWPAKEERVAAPTTHLDAVMPVWQFNERHVTHVNTTPERIFDAIHAVTPNEILLFRTLTTIRRLGRAAPPSIMNAPENEPLLHLATRTSFRYLADDPPKEIVVGTIIVPPRAIVATMNFLITPDKDGALVSTETRVFANSQGMVKRFKVYWRVIRPGSDIIRRMWLRAIKIRAERAV